MDNGYPFFLTVTDIAKSALFPVKKNFPFISPEGPDAAQHIHQGRLPRSVFADQCMDLILFYFQIHMIKRAYPRKTFGDIPHFQYYIFHVAFPLFHVTDSETRLLSRPQL